jgi:Putative peptidoglycan binding domain
MTYDGYFSSSKYGRVTVLKNGVSGGSFTGGPPKIVLHTTEGSGLPSYEGGLTAPHLTVQFMDSATGFMEIHSHTPLGVASRSLKNAPGGVETNRDGVIQIEIIGTSDPRMGHTLTYIPAINGACKTALAGLLNELAELRGMRRNILPKERWVSYPSSAGFNAPQRLSLSAWDSFEGVCGHEHPPENDHGDPGSLWIGDYFGTVNPPTVIPPPHYNSPPVFPLAHDPQPSYSNLWHSGLQSSIDRYNIRVLQAQLRFRGWKIDVDGIYGPTTVKTIQAFQKEKQIPATGRCDSHTWYAMWVSPFDNPEIGTDMLNAYQKPEDPANPAANDAVWTFEGGVNGELRHISKDEHLQYMKYNADNHTVIYKVWQLPVTDPVWSHLPTV